MSEVVPSGSSAGGNTQSPAKRESPSSRWLFTLNNYTEEEYGSMVVYFTKSNDHYIIGKELGELQTPHLQGYVEFNIKKRFTTLHNLFPRCHWERAKGSKNDNINYCSKEKNYQTNFKLPRAFKWPTFNKTWQTRIFEIIKEEPKDRIIYWIWSDKGNIGKTTFTNYLAVTHQAILCPVKTNDAFHRIAKECEEGNPIDLVVFDIPRSSANFINYQAIEKIKDGQVISGKYEGMQCIFPSPHIIVFSNDTPDRKKLSPDRWVIVNIDESD